MSGSHRSLASSNGSHPSQGDNDQERGNNVHLTSNAVSSDSVTALAEILQEDQSYFNAITLKGLSDSLGVGGGAADTDQELDDILDAVKLFVRQMKVNDNSEASDEVKKASSRCADTDDEEEDEEDEAPPQVVIKYDDYERKAAQALSSSSIIGPSSLRLALVAKHHSLWAEYIYNAARYNLKIPRFSLHLFYNISSL
jgi:hypothetical protein